MQQSVNLGTQTWINEAGPAFSLVGVCLSTRVAELAGENHYSSPVRCWPMLASVESEVPGSVWAVAGRWMQGWGSDWWVVIVTGMNLTPQRRRDPGLAVVDVKIGTFGA